MTHSLSVTSPPLSLAIRDLKLGLVGEDVRQLQKMLNAQKFYVSENGVGSPGKETNFFGVLTQKALIKFQKDNNITPSVGYFGSKTRGVIESKGLKWW